MGPRLSNHPGRGRAWAGGPEDRRSAASYGGKTLNFCGAAGTRHCACRLICWHLHLLVRRGGCQAGYGGKGRGQLTVFDEEQRGQMGESPGASALYIASLAEELARLARTHGFETLAYLLDLARLEADHISKSSSSKP